MGRLHVVVTALALAAFVLVPALSTVHADAAPVAPASVKPLRIALIDTGIDANHPEFAPGQIVAWKDFTAENSPTPKDGFGHGTATASLVAGRNVGGCGDNVNAPKLSYAPGASLIIARVGTDAGAITGDITAAARWAVAQGADVISMSIGSTIPLPSYQPGLREARAAGVVVVVAAGNGLLNAGTAPYPSWLGSYGAMPDAIAVGASTHGGGSSLIGNDDPDVSSWGSSVCVALAGTTGYAREGGTSFATPLVAGMAGRAIEIARANGQPADAAHITTLLLYSASNSPLLPYTREGMGFLLEGSWNKIATNAAAGTIPNYDAQGAWATADRTYREQVMLPLRGTIT